MPSIILGVPGQWDSFVAVQKVLEQRGFAWLAPTAMVVRIADDKPISLLIEVHDRHPELRRAFEAAGRGTLSAALLDKIEKHTMTLYLVSNDPASVATANAVMTFASMILEAGGLAVKVECSGAGHAPKEWREHLGAALPGVAAVSALTVLVGSGDRASSCGMHQLGLPDVDAPRSAGAETLLEFNAFQAVESPTFREGSTFSLRPEKPAYRLRKKPSRYPREQLFHNPFGEWHLEAI